MSAKVVIYLSIILAISATIYFYLRGYIVAYGDAESHLNISKRVVDSLTPGLAQLGGIWLPLPHIFMVPFTAFDFLWRTGLAGSIVSGLTFILASLFLYKLTYLVTKNKLASLVAFLTFALNPNILYMQSTAMTELPLVAFFIGSSYYFVKFLKNDDQILDLIFAGFFGLCASLTRYDGWFLVGSEAFILILFYGYKLWTSHANHKDIWHVLEGKTILFSTLAFFGIFVWLLWDFLILGDPLYFTNSPFSAKSQQQGWLARGELPAYHNLSASFLYYLFTAELNIGIIVSLLSLVGLLIFLLDKKQVAKLPLLLLLLNPFIFYIITLYLGQSVIFIPQLAPTTFTWRLFNARYGLTMVAPAAFYVGYLFFKLSQTAYLKWLKVATEVTMAGFILLQTFNFYLGKEPVITLEDALRGLSSAKISSAQDWLNQNYDGGLVLIDDYSRTLSIVRTNIPMKDIIYIGNKPYWQESLQEPEKYARWLIMQKSDVVWTTLYENQTMQARVYKYFEKAYTSPDILVFKRMNNSAPQASL
jgi:hypothetical protein